MPELGQIIKDAIRTKNGVGVGESHYNKEIIKFNDDVIAKEFINQSKALKKTPILLIEDNFGAMPIEVDQSDGRTVRTNIANFLNNCGKLSPVQFEPIKKRLVDYLSEGADRQKDLTEIKAAVAERLEMYYRFAHEGGKAVSLDTSNIFTESQSKRYLELLHKNQKSPSEKEEYQELVQINHKNAIQNWSPTLSKYLNDPKYAVMVYTGAGHTDLHQKFGLVSFLNTSVSFNDPKKEYIVNAGRVANYADFVEGEKVTNVKNIYFIDLPMYKKLEDEKSHTAPKAPAPKATPAKGSKKSSMLEGNGIDTDIMIGLNNVKHDAELENSSLSTLPLDKVKKSITDINLG